MNQVCDFPAASFFLPHPSASHRQMFSTLACYGGLLRLGHLGPVGRVFWVSLVSIFFGVQGAGSAFAQGDWEITPQSAEALERGLQWLARHQGPEGNWSSDDLGLVSTGLLAFLAAGHLPGRGPYGQTVQRALDYVLRNVQPSGLLNIADQRRDMYNHGLSAFMLGQVYGMTGDSRVGTVLDRALKLIAYTQCLDGGWDYVARRQQNGHDLSLAVMQALALRSAVDSGLEVSPEVVEKAIRCVREHYTPRGVRREAPDEELKKYPGQFTYSKGGGNATVAMAAAGVVCLQEFGQYDDWRIPKSMEVVLRAIREECRPERARQSRRPPFDAYTLNYVAQALYQVGGQPWQEHYPLLRDAVVASQIVAPDRPEDHGKWVGENRVGGKPGDLYLTSVCCFVLAIPNRYLPILQEGRIGSLEAQFGGQFNPEAATPTGKPKRPPRR